MRLIAAAVLAVLAIPAVAASAPATPSDAEATTVGIQLMEWMVMPAKSRVAAGKVTFKVTNAGKLKHDFVVLKTNLAPSKLPMTGQKAKEVGLVGKTPVLSKGQARKLTLSLKSARYVLLCNVPGHYMAGMRIAFRAG